MARLNLSSVRKRFGSAEIIKGVDIDIEHGEFVVFVGPSGCGKSTLLRMIAGLEDISSGQISIADRVVNDLPPKDRSIAMVFQSYALFPHMTARQNVAFGLKIARVEKAEIGRKVDEAAAMLQLEPFLDRKPSQLSGGQRQRVAIGRAIVANPEVFLFDEPLSNLDAALRVNTRAQLARLHRELGATMVYVTHDQVEAMTLADRIVVLESGEVRQFGTPMDLYTHPHNQFVAGFIGSPKMNFLDVSVDRFDTNGISVSSPQIKSTMIPSANPQGIAEGQRLTLGIRPEHVRISSEADAMCSGVVELVERLGHETFIEVRLLPTVVMSALLNGDAAVKVAEELHLTFAGDDCHLFHDNGDAISKSAAVGQAAIA